MRTGICHLCTQTAELCESHALPNSLFSYILRKSNGKAVVITDDETTSIQYSSDSWDTALLCIACEERLNRNYDAYAMGVFRGHLAAFRRGEAGVTFTGVKRQRLRMFFLSVLWRISVSSHESYSNVDLPYRWEDELHDALQQERNIPNSRFTVALCRLRDSTATHGFSDENLRGFIMAPFARQYEGFVSICYPFLGFFVQTFLPRLPKAFANQPGVLSGPSTVFMTPFQEVLDVPEIMSVLLRGLQKHQAGLTQVG